MKHDFTNFKATSNKSRMDKSFLDEALAESDASLLHFDEARGDLNYIPTTFRKKTHNREDFLDEDKRSKERFSEKTNALKEFLESRKRVNENLMYGASEEEFDQEVGGEFGREVLEICKNHNITGEAIPKAFNKLSDLLGSNPDVDKALETWSPSSNSESDGEEEEEDEEEMEESTNRFPSTIEEMTRTLRRKIAENRIIAKKRSRRRF